jgi:hypothetical protein
VRDDIEVNASSELEEELDAETLEAEYLVIASPIRFLLT